MHLHSPVHPPHLTCSHVPDNPPPGEIITGISHARQPSLVEITAGYAQLQDNPPAVNVNPGVLPYKILRVLLKQMLACSAADPVHSISAVASPPQLVTYSSLPPMAPALATAAADQLPPRQRSIKWPVAAATGRTPDQPSASSGKPTVQPATNIGSSEAGATTDQARA